MRMALGTGRRQREGENEVGHGDVVAAVHGIRAVVPGASTADRHGSLSDEREVDAAALDDDPEVAADDPEANLCPAPGRGRVVALDRRKVVAGVDRAAAVALDRIAD